MLFDLLQIVLDLIELCGCHTHEGSPCITHALELNLSSHVRYLDCEVVSRVCLIHVLLAALTIEAFLTFLSNFLLAHGTSEIKHMLVSREFCWNENPRTDTVDSIVAGLFSTM